MSQLLLGSGGGNMMQRVALLECIPLALERYWNNAKMKYNNTAATSFKVSCWNKERAMFAIDAAAGAVLLGGAGNVIVPASLVAFVESHRRKTLCSQSLTSPSSPQSSFHDNMDCEHQGVFSADKEAKIGDRAMPIEPRESEEESESMVERETELSMKEWDILRNEQCLTVLLDIHQSKNNKYCCNDKCGSNDSCASIEKSETSHTAFEEFVSQYKEMYTKFCIPVPASPIASKLFFNNIPLDTFDAHYLAKFKEEIAQAGSCYSWQAWMRSALSCCYEGNYLPPIRLAEQTAKLLANSYNVHLSHQNSSNNDGRLLCGCSGVIWESAIGNGLTPRWLETSVKTAVSCGVPVHALTLALADNSNSSINSGDSNTLNNHKAIVPLIYKGLEMGITSYATCSLPDICAFDKTQTLPALDTVTELMDGYNAFHAANNYYQVINVKENSYNKKSVAGDNVVNAVGNSQEYTDAVCSTWLSLQS